MKSKRATIKLQEGQAKLFERFDDWCVMRRADCIGTSPDRAGYFSNPDQRVELLHLRPVRVLGLGRLCKFFESGFTNSVYGAPHKQRSVDV